MTDLREIILDSVGACVTAQGFGATTLDAVAQRANVSRATVYRLFTNGRDELMAAFVSREIDRFFDDLLAYTSKFEDLQSVLTEGIHHARQNVVNHPLLQQALAEDAMVLERPLVDMTVAIEGGIAEFVAPYLPTGTHREERSDYIARMALSYISAQGRWDLSSIDQVRNLVNYELLVSPTIRPKRVHATEPRALPTTRDTTARRRAANEVMRALRKGELEKLSMEMLADRTRVSRATMYRLFPGGRRDLFVTTVEMEISRIFAAIASVIVEAPSLDVALLGALTTLGRHLTTHPGLQAVLRQRPELVHDLLRFQKADVNFVVAAEQVAPLLTRWLPREAAARVAEWFLRVAASYWIDESPYLKLSDPASIAQFYNRHLAAGVAAFADVHGAEQARTGARSAGSVPS